EAPRRVAPRAPATARRRRAPLVHHRFASPGVYCMSAARGKRSSPPRRPDDGRGGAASGAGRPAEPGGRVPDLLRRVVGLGFSGFFMTEEVVRRALGETLPREWVEF